MNKRTNIRSGAALAAVVLGLCVGVSAQTTGGDPVAANQPKPAPTAAATKAIKAPAMKEFRHAGIGTAADELKKAWGKPEIEDKDGFIFEFSDKEMAQVALDGEKKVDTIAFTFRDGTGAPKAEDVFGPGEKIERKPDGSHFHMVRYPEAGYWVSYLSQGAGKMVILTFKKI